MSEEINKTDNADQKFNWLPWIAILCLIFVGLFILISNQDAPAPEPTSTVTVSSTTEFTYEPEDVELKDENGVLLAYAKGQRVPFTGVVRKQEASYVSISGRVDPSFNGTFLEGETLWIVHNGKLATGTHGIVPAGNGEWYSVDYGVVQTDFSGIQSNEYGSWYIEDGKVQFGYNGVIETTENTYLISNGKVNTSTSGVVPTGNGKWVYVDKGVVQTDYSGVQKNNYGNWYIDNGYVNFHYSGDTYSGGNDYVVDKGKATLKTTKAYSSGGFSGSGSFNTIDDDDDYYSSSSSGRYVGNSSTGLFHIVGGCSAAHGDEYFDYYNQARAAGYRRCPNCPFY